MTTLQPTTEEYAARVEQCAMLLVKGYNQAEVVQYILTKTEWGKDVTDRTVRNYCYRARDELARMATDSVDRREEFAKAVVRLTEQYKRANQLNDVARATAAVNSMISLLKLDQPNIAFSWENSAAALGLEDDQRARLKDAAQKMLTLAVRAPDSMNELCEVINKLYEHHQLAAELS